MKRVLILLSFVMMIMLSGCGENESPKEILKMSLMKSDMFEDIDINCMVEQISSKLNDDEIITLSQFLKDENAKDSLSKQDREDLIEVLTPAILICAKK